LFLSYFSKFRARPIRISSAQCAKVFCFFFSKKKTFLVFSCLAVANAAAATIDIDVAKTYGGISLATIDQAIDQARRRFRTSPNDVITLDLPAGVFHLSAGSGDAASIDVSHVQPRAQGRLILKGAGSDRTTLVFDTHRDQIVGRGAAHIAFVGLHFTVGYLTVSQGHVERVLPDAVVLRIEDGFPTPGDLFDPDIRAGRYLRRCTDSASAPEMEEFDNGQVPWWRAEPLADRLWRMDIRQRPEGATFRIGDLVAIKSKHNDGSAYRFLGSSDITFDDVLWTRNTRGVFRAGTSHVRILNSRIERDPAIDGHVPCLASSAGGPQIGQPRDPETGGNVVENFLATGTGDDAIAFFNASGRVDHVKITDSFARGILLFNSGGVTLDQVDAERAPVLRR
jgi:hypothetical protein